jgi:hypothetical protein
VAADGVQSSSALFGAEEADASGGCCGVFCPSQGKLTYDAEGTTYYQGQWKNGMKEGFGKMQYASGNYYEGSWKADAKTGMGVMHWVTCNEVYDGRWEHGEPDGHGEHTWFMGAHAQDALMPDTRANDASQFQVTERPLPRPPSPVTPSRSLPQRSCSSSQAQAVLTPCSPRVGRCDARLTAVVTSKSRGVDSAHSSIAITANSEETAWGGGAGVSMVGTEAVV